jgi:CRISPR/Cas system Type II protein with McrA/HNH and RuvC-like nuclease domain
MNINNLWENEFRNKTKAKDFAGREIRKNVSANSPYVCDIDHIKPKSNNGKDGIKNLKVVSKLTNDEKGDKPTFNIEGVRYQIRKTKNANKSEWVKYDYSNKEYCIVVLED